ncbi:MAG: hypothetical protein IJ756_05225 [Paludibacteraceae bacterium]|nr:hypothetical protein [Paludibacteraceae bacterium]MBR1786546.1 hypothetical protein [Paludibacteraceae bacterium]
MKILSNILTTKRSFSAAFYALTALAVIVLSSCSDKYIAEHGNGKPAVIDYVRVCDPLKADSAIYEAEMLSTIAIVGSNLQAVKTILFGETEAALNSSLVSKHAIIVTVPFSLEISDNMRLITADNKITDYPFRAYIPAPALYNMLCEYAYDGDTVTINGNFFYSPLSAYFNGEMEATVAEMSTTELKLIVPAGATEGPITVETAYGKAVSDFHFRDTRGLITDFRNLEWGNSYLKGANGEEDGIDGNYLLMQTPALGAWVWNDALAGCYWSADGRGVEPIAQGMADTLALKFEINIVNWFDVPMIIWFKKSTEEFSVDDNNAQYHYKPWLNEDGTVHNARTGGWRTVEIPLSLFNTNKEESSNERMLGDMSQYNDFDVFLFGAQTDQTQKYPVDIRFDNPRIVPYKIKAE